MVLYWLVSIPCGNSDKLKLKEKLFKSLKQSKIENYEFEVPQLKIGTQDALYTLLDETQKFDQTLENITLKIGKNLKDVSELPEDEFKPKIILNGDQSIDLKMYFSHFHWDEKKYSMKSKDLQNLTETIYKSTMKLDDDLKVKLVDFNTLKSNLAQIDRREAGAITVRSLDGIIKKRTYN